MSTDSELFDKAYQLAYKYEAKLGSCPQCVLAALYKVFDIGDPKIIQAADSLAGGTALSTQGTCGALVGGMLAIGIVAGRDYEDFKMGMTKRRVFKFARELYDRFVEEYGSPVCCGVQKKLFGKSFNLLDPKDYAAFEEAGAHVDKCPSVSGNVARWAAEIIVKEIKK